MSLPLKDDDGLTTSCLINNCTVDLNLNIEGTLAPEWASNFEKATARFNALDTHFLQVIDEYSTQEHNPANDNAKTVVEFMQFHRDELPNELLENLLALARDKNNVMSALTLNQISIYPDKETTLVWDYIFHDPADEIGISITDQILVFNTDLAGMVLSIAWES